MDHEFDRIRRIVRVERDRVPLLASLQRVLDHVPEDLLEQQGIGEDHRVPRLPLDAERPALRLRSLFVELDHLLERLQRAHPSRLNVQLAALGRRHDPVLVYLLDQRVGKAVGHAPEQLQLGRVGLSQFRGVLPHLPGVAEDPLKQDALEHLPPLFVTHVVHAEDRVLPSLQLERSSRDPQVERLAVLRGHNPALPRVLLSLLTGQDRQHRPAVAARLARAAAARRLVGVGAAQNLPGPRPVHLSGIFAAQKLEQPLVGEDHLPLVVENDHDVRRCVEQLAQHGDGQQPAGLLLHLRLAVALGRGEQRLFLFSHRTHSFR